MNGLYDGLNTFLNDIKKADQKILSQCILKGDTSTEWILWYFNKMEIV